jgi:hypothetical protein
MKMNRAIALLVALPAMGLAGAPVATAAPAPPASFREEAALRIEGMAPIPAADLARFTGLAVRLAQAAQSDATVAPLLEGVVERHDRGIVKRAIAYLALCAMGREPVARGLVAGRSMRDRAVLRIVAAASALQHRLTMVPGR